MTKTMNLIEVGTVEGTPAGELKVGDVTRWNYGSLERITSVEFSKTGKTIIVGIEYKKHNGELVTSERKFRVTRLVNIVGRGNTRLTSEYSFENVVEKVVEKVEPKEVPAENFVSYFEEGHEVEVTCQVSGEKWDAVVVEVNHKVKEITVSVANEDGTFTRLKFSKPESNGFMFYLRTYEDINVEETQEKISLENAGAEEILNLGYENVSLHKSVKGEKGKIDHIIYYAHKGNESHGITLELNSNELVIYDWVNDYLIDRVATKGKYDDSENVEKPLEIKKAFFSSKPANVKEVEERKLSSYDDYAVMEEIELDSVEFYELSNDLLDTYDFLEGKGGTYTTADISDFEDIPFFNWTQEQRSRFLKGSYRACVKVTNKTAEYSLLIDSQGYNYGRYVAIEWS